MAVSRSHPASTVIHSFDPYPGDDVPAVCERNGNVHSHACVGELGSANWTDLCGKPVDFLVIDGSHTLKALNTDYESWRRLLSSRGAVLFHDYDPEKRAGISHPGVKVFCDALVATCGTEVTTEHVGRYLLIETKAAEAVVLDRQKMAANKWISRALDAAAVLQRRLASGELRLEGVMAGHSRIRIGRSDAEPVELGDIDDAAIVLLLVHEAPSLHEALIKLLPDPKHVLKWIEYLEMFLHARKWPLSHGISSASHPILSSIEACISVDDLSRFCADIAVLGGITESIFSGVTQQ